ncbi:MAG: hypothetical protein QOH56_2668 [Pseudonocardiales bacterium]|nr:hypothetical protein [Pseudonocardiales bacterium]
MTEAGVDMVARTTLAAGRHARGRQRRRRALLSVAALVVALLFAVGVWGGYRLNWRWTGLSKSVTLWDWLQVLALPLAVGLAPMLLHHRGNLTSKHRGLVAVATLAFGVLVLLGYLVPMRWTGFTDNRLWDWLELLLLPLVVATASLWADRKRIRRGHLIAGGALVVIFVAVALCGYLVPWSWTGFRGNTAWDWLKLLLLPLVVPAILLPLIQQRITVRLRPGAANRVAADSVALDRVAADPGVADRVAADPGVADRIAADRNAADSVRSRR